jgi:hypothetical protein
MAAVKEKATISLRAEVAEKFQLKKTVTAPVIHVSGIIGEIDFTKITLEEIDAYPRLEEFLDKK